MGEHIDYNRGLALPMALPQRAYAAVTRRRDRILRVHSAHARQSLEVDLNRATLHPPTGWARYPVAVMLAMEEVGFPAGGLDLTLHSRVPVGAGLSSSAAIECAVASAASDLFGHDLLADPGGRLRIADICQLAENRLVGVPSGGLDQRAAMLCPPGGALLLDFASDEITPERLSVADEKDEHVWVVLDTRASHSLADGQYAARRRSCEDASRLLGVKSLRDIDQGSLQHALALLPSEELRACGRHVVQEPWRVPAMVTALQVEDPLEISDLMRASHASLRDDYRVSSPQLDLAVDAATASGAIGARMTGGGFGGSAIALVPRGSTKLVQQAVQDAFARRRWASPEVFDIVPGAPATRHR